jgi:alanine racemase
LSLRAEVAFVKQIPVGESVSYGATWTASQPTNLATLPIGYGDGYRRELSNQASVLIHGQRCPLRGRVCMDQFMVDLGEQSISLGESATLIGEQGVEVITVEDLAALCGAIPYEILTGFNERLPRIYRG